MVRETLPVDNELLIKCSNGSWRVRIKFDKNV
jgi:hypothetical protein